MKRISKQKQGSFSPLLWILTFLLVIFLVADGVFIYFTFFHKPDQSSANTPAPTLTAPVISFVDNGRPTVAVQRPSKTQELPLDGAIEIIFNQPMDAQSTQSAWQLIGPDEKPIPGSITWKDEQTFVFKPDTPLTKSTKYQGKFTEIAASSSGTKLEDEIDLEFRTVGDLEVSQVFPADGSWDVPAGTLVTVIFNRPVVPLEKSGNIDQAILEMNPPVSGNGKWQDTSIYTFQPDQPLQMGINYTVRVKAGLQDAVQDTALETDYAWSFRTAPPKFIGFNLSNSARPGDNAFDVPLDEKITLTFGQPMDRASTEALISLAAFDGKTVPLSFEWGENETRVTAAPAQRLNSGTSYTFTLRSGTKTKDGSILQDWKTWNFTTVYPPTIQSISPRNSETQTEFSDSIRIAFSNRMDPTSFTDKIVIQPAPKKPVLWEPVDRSGQKSGFFYQAQILEPSTNYQLRILPGVKDINNLPTTQDVSISFTTAPRSPMAYMLMRPGYPAVFRVNDQQDLYFSCQNVETANLYIFPLTAEQFVGGRPPDSGPVSILPVSCSGEENQRVMGQTILRTSADQPLSTGFYRLVLSFQPVPSYRSLFDEGSASQADSRNIIVANANITVKKSGTDFLAWLTDMESGRPLSGVPLKFYNGKHDLMYENNTDEKGIIYSDIPADQAPKEPAYVMTGGGAYFAYANTEWGSGVSPKDFGIASEYYAAPAEATAFVYTDRPVYRPGQPVNFKGIVRLNDDLSYLMPQQNEVQVIIKQFDKIIKTLTFPLSPYGTFNGQFVLDPQTPVGNYMVEVFLAGDKETIGGIKFSVAEYQKPEFEVRLSPDQRDIFPNGNNTIRVETNYFSGGSVANANVEWVLKAETQRFIQPGVFSGYDFADLERDDKNELLAAPSEKTLLAEGVGKTDANGVFVLPLSGHLNNPSSSLKLTLEVRVVDIFGNQADGSTSLMLHHTSVYVGAKPQARIGLAGREQIFEIAAVDYKGQPVPNQKMSVQVFYRNWYSVVQLTPEGYQKWIAAVDTTPEGNAVEVNSDANGRAVFRYTPGKGGIYSLHVSTVDANGLKTQTAAYQWVKSDEYIPWKQTNDKSLPIILDKTSYAPGETAKIMIASPFEGEASALITVERGHIFFRDMVTFSGTSTMYNLPITSDMIPNAYISVVLVKGVTDNFVSRPTFRAGIVPFRVNPQDRQVSLEVSVDTPVASPGQQVNYTIRTRDQHGNPVNAEVSLALNDLAVMKLAGSNARPMMDFFYSAYKLNISTSIGLVNSIEDYNAYIQQNFEGQSGGSGGEKGLGDIGVIHISSDFPDTAYWNASVVTGEQGEATVSITLPDNLTTWELDAKAVTQDTRLGENIKVLVSTKPLLLRPQTPRFFMVGDTVLLGTVVQNNTGQPVIATVKVESNEVAIPQNVTQPFEIPANQQAQVSWEVAIQPVQKDNPSFDRVNLTFTANATGKDTGEKFVDATVPPQAGAEGIPVYRYEDFNITTTSGDLPKAGSKVEAIHLPDDANIKGSLLIEVAPSLTACLVSSMREMEDQPSNNVEETVSILLPKLIAANLLKENGKSTSNQSASLDEQLNNILQRLYSRQNAQDNGWSWTSEKESDLLTTTYVVLALETARNTGYMIDEGRLQRAVDYLSKSIETKFTNPQMLNEPGALDNAAFALNVLTRFNRNDTDQANFLYARRDELSLYGRAFLAKTLFQLNAQDQRISTILAELVAAAKHVSYGSYFTEAQEDAKNWSTNTRTTAIILSVLDEIQPQNALNERIVRWLMYNRVGAHWGSSQETAWALVALSQWAIHNRDLQASYAYEVDLNGQRLSADKVTPQDMLAPRSIAPLQINQMTMGAINRLSFARDEGPGNMYYMAQMRVFVPNQTDQPIPGQPILVSRGYYRPENIEQEINQAKRGDVIVARLVIVVKEDMDYVEIEDPFAAGLEPLNQLNRNSSGVLSPIKEQEQVLNNGIWRDYFQVGYYDEKVVLSANHLPAGTYVYTYLLRCGTPGTFLTPPPTAKEVYNPEVYNRGQKGTFVITWNP